MSFKKYRFIDLFIFLILYLVIEFLIETAAIKWFPEEIFSVSLLLPLSILVMIRWEWFAVPNVLIYAAAYVLYSARPGTFSQYMIYLFGALGLVLTIFMFTKKKSQKIISKWYFTLLYVFIAYVIMNTFRGFGAMIFADFGIEIIWNYLWTDSLNLVFALLVILISRRAQGVLINQKTYLLALEKEKEANKRKLEEDQELEQD